MNCGTEGSLRAFLLDGSESLPPTPDWPGAFPWVCAQEAASMWGLALSGSSCSLLASQLLIGQQRWPAGCEPRANKPFSVLIYLHCTRAPQGPAARSPPQCHLPPLAHPHGGRTSSSPIQQDPCPPLHSPPAQEAPEPRGEATIATGQAKQLPQNGAYEPHPRCPHPSTMNN